ncbi:MAG: oligosaccharide flippase family protein [Chlorobiaceae bacterium]|nr:oligosaccharide flippase family protein [Chlorobiaceae bacterium]
MSRNIVIAGQAGFSYGGFLFGQAARFGYNLLVARLLGAEFLGVYALAVAVIQIAEMIAVIGLDSALLRYINVYSDDSARQRKVIGSALKISLFVSLAVSTLLLVLSQDIASTLHGKGLLRLAICCYAAAVPFNAATLLFGHAIQGFRRLQPKVTATQVVSPLLLLLLTLVLRYTAGFEAALLFPFALSAAGTFLWIRPYLAEYTGTTGKDIAAAPFDSTILNYALPFMFISLLSMIMHWLDIVMLGAFTDTATVGLYHPAARTAGIVRSVFLAFSGIAAPMIAELHSAKKYIEIARIFRMITRWIITLIIPPVILFIFMPETVLGMFGPQFISGSMALILLSISAFFQAGLGLSTTVLAMTGYSKLSLVNSLGALLLQIALNLLLIPRMGFNGAALANLLVFFLLAAVRLMQVHNLFDIHPFGKSLWKPFIAGLITAGTLIAVRPWLVTFPFIGGLIPGAFVTVAVYTALLLVLKLEEDEREIILKIFPFLNNEAG